MKLAIVITFLLFWLDSFACTCIPPPPLDSKELDRYSLVAKGTIIKVKTDRCSISMTMKVDTLYKGSFDKDSVATFFSDCSSCGLTAEVREHWLIFAYQEQDQNVTDICTRSIQVTGLDTSALHYDYLMARLKNDQEFLNSIYKPLPKNDSNFLTPIIFLSALLLASVIAYSINRS